MVDVARLQGLALSSDEIRQLTGWGDAMVEDYLNILQNIIELAGTGEVTDVDVSDHINNDLIHFTVASIRHDLIIGNGIYDHGVIDSHINNNAYHFAKESIAEVPVGAIIMYNGLLALIPTRYLLCDGTNGTPDLTDMFVLGTNTEGELGDTGNMADETTPSANYDWIKLAFIRRMS